MFSFRKLLQFSCFLIIATTFYSFKGDNGLQVGQLAPEISLPNQQGDTIHLSDFNGKIVLIDFWASWCKPCRYENHKIRQSYLKYRDSSFTGGTGFSIYSISLDTDSLRWTKAIKNDHLYWDSHVSDFKKWNSPASITYGVRSLPQNILINGEGKIIAKNLFGQELESKLESLVHN